ncbi:MAG TPA: prepilin-type N-terminal cleavage/methylation domain-containing protein [Oscillatoriaceae cyanobacterium]
MRVGFTLIEVLVATSVLTLAIAGAAIVMTSAYGAYHHQDRRLVMNQLVHDEMESLTVTPYDQLRTDIKSARAPQSPTHDGTPPDQDFQSINGGKAQARYDLEPPKDPQGDWAPKARPASNQTSYVQGQHVDNAMHATLSLEFWDPTFDSPSLTDRGLIRAVYTVNTTGMPSDSAVKYLAR